MIQRPSTEVLEYMRASGCAAIAIVCAPGGAVAVVHGADPWNAAGAGTVAEAGWVFGDDAAAAGAQRIDAVRLSPSVSALQSPREGAFWAFGYCAPAIGIVPHQNALSAAEAAVAGVIAEYDRMLVRGDMRAINRAYKERRLAGVRQPPYSTFVRDYRLEMVRAAGKAASARSIGLRG